MENTESNGKNPLSSSLFTTNQSLSSLTFAYGNCPFFSFLTPKFYLKLPV